MPAGAVRQLTDNGFIRKTSDRHAQSTATVHGSSNEDGFLIDGMDVSNLDGNGTGAVLYLDPHAFQETNYQTSGGGTAVSQKSGLIFNMVTRTGINRFHGGAMFNGESRHGVRELLAGAAHPVAGRGPRSRAGGQTPTSCRARTS